MGFVKLFCAPPPVLFLEPIFEGSISLLHRLQSIMLPSWLAVSLLLRQVLVCGYLGPVIKGPRPPSNSQTVPCLMA